MTSGNAAVSVVSSAGIDQDGREKYTNAGKVVGETARKYPATPASTSTATEPSAATVASATNGVSQSKSSTWQKSTTRSGGGNSDAVATKRIRIRALGPGSTGQLAAPKHDQSAPCPSAAPPSPPPPACPADPLATQTESRQTPGKPSEPQSFDDAH